MTERRRKRSLRDYGSSEEKKRRENVSGFATYLFEHWEAIRQRKCGGLPGSCTEGQVSHVIAERFSRDPQGWGKAGLGKLSKLRVYVINGGTITGEAFAEEDDVGKEETYMEQMMREHLREALDWSIFEKEDPIFDGASGTQIYIKGIGQYHSSLLS